MSNIEWVIELENHPLYFVSNLGKAYSLKNGKQLRELKQTKCKNGYFCFTASRKTLFTHRIMALTFLKREKGKDLVDHINRIRTDNRLENLRWSNYRENAINSKSRKNNTTGIKGVSFDKSRIRWKVSIYLDKGKEKCFYFKNKEDAILYRKQMENKYYQKI